MNLQITKISVAIRVNNKLGTAEKHTRISSADHSRNP